MKFTLSWLKQHLDTNASLEAICEKLTSLGLEVEKVEDRGKTLAPFIVAQVLTAEKHPQAGRLKLATVDTGKEKLQVVCGAPNCHAGMKAVLARPGDVMPDSGEALKKGVIRGVESQGMLCAADELGLGGDHEGIIELPADASVGKSFAEYAGFNDPVIEINLTPNRPDCAGVYGIARDLAASGLGKLKPLTVEAIRGKEPSRIKVKLEFAKTDPACPLFVGRLIRNIKNGPSPAWLQQRLTAIGLRPISALVDITNYLTFDCARPLHVFDAKKVQGNIRLYPAKGGEKLRALDGNSYTLETGMTAIADDSGVISLGGLMGGQSTRCEDDTTEVFIESAWFDPARTAKTGRALQLTSDARYRFERGVDPQFTIPGAELATKLVLEFCGTKETVVAELEIAGAPPSHERVIALDPAKCKKHAGVDVPEAEQEKILTALGFEVTKKVSLPLVGRVREGGVPQASKVDPTGHASPSVTPPPLTPPTRGGEHVLHVKPPSWRPDIEGSADLVEEIIRVKGYDAIPAVSMPRLSPVTASAIDLADARANAARRALAAQGLLEAVTWSFMSSAIANYFVPSSGKSGGILPPLRGELEGGSVQAEKTPHPTSPSRGEESGHSQRIDAFSTLRLSNPISADLDVMRPSILGNLILAAKRNADRGFADAGLFEVGPVYKNTTPEGQETVPTLLRAGNTPRHWAAPSRPVDAFDAKADAIAALAASGAPTGNLQVTNEAPAYYHPGRSGALNLGPALLAVFGEIHPAVLAACDAEGPMVGAEIFLSAIPQSRASGSAKPPLKLEALQPVARDFAFVVDRDVTAAKLVKAVKDADKNLIREVAVFDVYEGKNIDAGKKSVALSVTLQPSDKTLTDAEIEALSAKITATVNKATGAVLRK